MLHPVGKLPARVYWRRRLVFVGLPLLVIIVLLWTALSGGGSRPSSRNTSSTTTRPSSSVPATPSAQPRDSESIGVSTTTPPAAAATSNSAASARSSSAAAKSSAAAASSIAAAGKGLCTTSNLDVTAETAKKSFAVHAKPGLSMLVTNTSTASCRLDVADKHVEWRVYSGDVRVWGSHDCAEQAGSNVMTLTARQAIRLSISWSGLTSSSPCTASRIAVQAGTYTLFAYLDGKRSPATTFTIK